MDNRVRIYLQKNDLSKNDKMPYFNLVIPPEEGKTDWVTVGALWKAKSGHGYTGLLNEGVVLDFTQMKKYEPKAKQD